MDTLHALATRSSCRGYLSDKLPAADLNLIVDAALQAPTGVDKKPLRFTLISRQELLEEITQEAYKNLGEEAKERMRKRGAVNLFYGAPHVILISSVGSAYEKVDAGIAAQSIALAAESLGYGSCIIAMAAAAFNPDSDTSCSKSVGFGPDEHFIVSVAFGRYETRKEPHTYVREDQLRVIG